MAEITGVFRYYANARKSVKCPTYRLIKIYFLDMWFFYENKFVTKFVRSGVIETFLSRTTEFKSTILFYHQIVWYFNTEAGIVNNLPAGLNYILQ